MDKLAQAIRAQEARGVLGALVDSGYVKLAADEHFDVLADHICENLPEEYDLDVALSKTAEVVEEYNGLLDEGEASLDKEAGEISEDDVTRYMGELTMMKMAGELSEEDFEKEANKVTDLLRRAGGAVQGAAPSKDAVKGAFKAKGAREGAADVKDYLSEVLHDRKLVRSGKADKGDVFLSPKNEGKGKSGAKKLLKGLGATGLAYGAAGTGVAGAGLGGKALYDKLTGDK